MSDWKTTPTPLLASTTLTRIRPDGVRVQVKVNLGIATSVPAGDALAGMVYSTIQIIWGEHENESLFFAGIAEDNLMAYGSAMSSIATLLSSLPFASELEVYNLLNFGFPQFPGLPIAAGTGALELQVRASRGGG